jgi:mono/diheme cytochrome c family protein
MAIILGSIGALVLCSDQVDCLRADEPSAEGIAYFETHIRPLLAERCYGCHSQRAEKQEGGLRLDARGAWLKGGARGAAVIPADLNGSLLIQAVRYTDPDFQMPPTEKIPDEAIAALETWIKMGAPAPHEDVATEFTHPSDPIAGKSHWAFQRLTKPNSPSVKNEHWPRSEIDRFVLAKLEHLDLNPVTDAAPRDLIRRLSFQIVGLPPLPAHLELYEQSPSQETLAVIVDELLASPQFGQRWGRHWLDLARYADSNGLDENFLFREAWRYRNWVIDAVNADMPFDRFLLEQLAGDLLPYDSIVQRDRQRIAAGFLVVGPKVLLGVNPQKQKMDVADEQIETIGRAVLGQTLGCARCHDHKFDPIPTADYYAMAGILTSTKVMEQRFMLNEQRVMERLVGLGENGEAVDDAYEAYWRNLRNLKSRAEKAKAALELLQQKNEQAITDKLTADGDGFCESAKDASVPIDQRIAAQEALVKELNESIAKPPAIPPRAMIPADAEKISDEAVRVSGKFDVTGDRVPRGFLKVLCDEDAVQLPADQSGRIELARWLTDPNSRAGWLTARVQANRIWHHLMGRGLVRTVDNLGRTGESPTHPELLDYLALQLIEDGWSFKSLIREIVLSRTFALSSQYEAANDARDPDNQWLWRAHRRRLDPESLRDAMLSAAGTLDLNPMESTVSYLGDQATAVGGNPVRRRTDFPCRSVYLPVIRNDLPELFEVFDFVNPHMSTGTRPKTTVPMQGLFMLNDAMVMAAAESTARRTIAETASQSSEAHIDRMFQLIVSSSPTDKEREALQSFLDATVSRFQSSSEPDSELKALTLACHALFASSRFQFLE